MLAEMKEHKMTQDQIAVQCNVKKAFVSRMVCAQRRDPDFLQKRKSKERAKAEKTNSVVVESEKLLDSAEDIWTAKQISDAVEERSNIKVLPQFVCKVLRNRLGLGYRQIKRTAYCGNNERSLVLRCLYA